MTGTDDGELFGARYEVLRTVSEGRRASVLQALDRVHDQLVALKVYPVVDEDRDALLAEAHVLMAIAPHPSLPVVRGDFFTDGGERYVVVMNWVDGTDLQEILERDGDPGLPLREVIDDLAKVADALDHLHAHDPPIVHGDVKPANIVRTNAGRVVLVDFDIAGAGIDRGRIGTRGFIAPEVAAGEKPGPPADVFGLAASAVTLLDGRSPGESAPMYSVVDDLERAGVARVLRNALAMDPARRPRSATRLVEKLRTAGRDALPTGVVALLAAEVVGAGRLWRRDPEATRVAMARLRDVRDEVVGQHGGNVVASMNEGDRSIIVFREASAAAVAALTLHEAVASEAFPPDLDVTLRAAMAVGEATLADGAYVGSVVDTVVAIRSIAGPGATVVPEPTAELLVGLVGNGISIVALGTSGGLADADDAPLFCLTRPGAEQTACLATARPVERRHDHDSNLEGIEIERDLDDDLPHRRDSASTAAQHPLTLSGVTLAGVSAIFLVVLSDELGSGAVAALLLVVATMVAAGSFAWHFADSERARREVVDERVRQRAADERLESLAAERAATRAQLERAFERLDSATAHDGLQAVGSLSVEFEGLISLVRRPDRTHAILPASVPDLTEEVYRRGMSALSDGLELLEFADGPSHRRLLDELEEVERRLESRSDRDERDRERDQRRRDSHRQLLHRHDEARQRAGDLIFEAERCVAALAEAGIELASARAGDTQMDADAVVDSLQAIVRSVREVQEELRRLGY